MMMPHSHFMRLQAIGTRPGVSSRTFLMVARKILRHIIVAEGLMEVSVRQAIRKAKAGLPFTASLLVEQKRLLKEGQVNRRAVLSIFGRWLRDNHRAIEDELGWEGLCDVLCVNPVHRGDIRQQDQGLLALTWVGGWYEDSSTYWGKWDQTGAGPITRAFEVCMREWMLENMDKLPDPFGPGGVFYGTPTYHRHPDGAMVRATPALTVHAGGESVVVASRPGRRNTIAPGAKASVAGFHPNVTRQE